MAKRIIDELLIFVLLGAIATIFLVLNFDFTLGVIFAIMIVVDYIIYSKDNSPSLEFESRADNRFEAVLWSVVLFGVFLALASGAIALIQSAPVTSLIDLIKSFSTKPPFLAESKAVSLFAYGVLIPIIETRFFVRLAEFFADRFGLSLSRSNLSNPRLWILFTWISIGFMLFHLTVKAALGAPALIATFIFMMVTLAGAVYFGEIKQVALLHVVNNLRALL